MQKIEEDSINREGLSEDNVVIEEEDDYENENKTADFQDRNQGFRLKNKIDFDHEAAEIRLCTTFLID